MIIPAVRRCDFCGGVIATHQPFTKVTIPMPRAVRDEVRRHVEAEVQPRYKGSPLAGLIDYEAMIPGTWELEQCVNCTATLLPTAAGTMTAQIRATIDRQIAARRATVAVSELAVAEEDE